MKKYRLVLVAVTLAVLSMLLSVATLTAQTTITGSSATGTVSTGTMPPAAATTGTMPSDTAAQGAMSTDTSAADYGTTTMADTSSATIPLDSDPSVLTTTMKTATATEVRTENNFQFPWGLFGLFGLLGLMKRPKVIRTVETVRETPVIRTTRDTHNDPRA